ncbi:MAG TPA: hypothetical protein VFX20_19365 [Steroidobacteraceae bacterium]|nr:hypothetical protein [Steroidobacteraceae bacterium]
MSAVPASRGGELEHSRLGVIYFLGKLQVDFSPEASATEMKNKALAALQGKVGSGKIMKAATKVGGLVEGIDKQVNEIAKTIQEWLVGKFNVAASDAELAVQHVRNNLPTLIKEIVSEITSTGKSGDIKELASGLVTAVSKSIDYFNLRHAGKGVVLESGHPDIVAQSIKHSIGRDALIGLAEAAFAGAKMALAAATSGVGEIINKIASVIKLLLEFAVRFCDALELRKVFADAKQKWAIHKQSDAIQKSPNGFAAWFQETVDHSPVCAALVMNCGVAGDAMSFLQVLTTSGTVVTQGQFDKGVTFLNALKSSASDLIMAVQEDMRIFSDDKIVSSLLQHAGEIGLVQKEANSSWRARIFGWTNQQGTKSKAANWVLNRLGYKQSTVFTRI